MEQFPINPNASSNVKWARYDPVRNLLEVDFKNADGDYQSTYEYQNVSRQDWEKFRESKKPGEHFAYYIRGKFPFKKLRDKRTPVPTVEQEKLF